MSLIKIELIAGALPPAEHWPEVSGAGAVLLFEGLVRPLEQAQPIAALDYEIYEPMARRQLQILAEELVEKHGLLAMHIQHSFGRVPVGACSFRLRLASAHRKEALRAMDEFIDRLKLDVPIWKRALPDCEQKHG